MCSHRANPRIFFLQMGHSRPLFSLFSSFQLLTVTMIIKNLPMTRFELGTSGLEQTTLPAEPQPIVLVVVQLTQWLLPIPEAYFVCHFFTVDCNRIEQMKMQQKRSGMALFIKLFRKNIPRGFRDRSCIVQLICSDRSYITYIDS